MITQYKHLIFDLGGVLVELGDQPIPNQATITNRSLTSREWFASPTAHRFEQGKISAEDFAKAMTHEFELDITAGQFLAYFTSWPRGVYGNVFAMMKRLSEDYELSVLSNCNEIHWPVMRDDFQILGAFDYCFSSHIIGLTKPDKRIFEYVLKSIRHKPSDVIFFDDNIKNIEAAKKSGISGFQVHGAEELEVLLKEHGLLPEGFAPD